MSEAPQITTPRLSVVPFAESFLTESYVGWLNDPEVVRFSTQRHAVHTVESCRAYRQSYTGTPHYFWAIVENERGLGHIGNINAYVDKRDQVTDLGILLGNKAAWRRGYGCEAWLAVCRYLFEKAGMRKITAGTCASNAAMLSLMKAAGMAEDGRRARHTIVEGREVDIIYAALFRESWIPSSLRSDMSTGGLAC